MKVKEEFYTEKRWLNWMNKVKESNFKLDEDESQNKNAGAVFIYIMDDVVLACLKIIARWEHKVISPEEALAEIEKMKEIVYKKGESLGEDADLMLDSLRTSLAAVFASSQRYIAGDYDKKEPLDALVKKALDSEAGGDFDAVFDALTQVGARVIGGEKGPDLGSEEMPFCMAAELLDGIDAISAAMIGEDSYKEDDGTADEGEEV